jgi:hypothetical protein
MPAPGIDAALTVQPDARFVCASTSVQCCLVKLEKKREVSPFHPASSPLAGRLRHHSPRRNSSSTGRDYCKRTVACPDAPANPLPDIHHRRFPRGSVHLKFPWIDNGKGKRFRDYWEVRARSRFRRRAPTTFPWLPLASRFRTTPTARAGISIPAQSAGNRFFLLRELAALSSTYGAASAPAFG